MSSWKPQVSIKSESWETEFSKNFHFLNFSALRLDRDVWSSRGPPPGTPDLNDDDDEDDNDANNNNNINKDNKEE